MSRRCECRQQGQARQPVVKVRSLYSSLIEEEAKLAAVFVPGKPSLIFVSNDVDYSVSAPSRVGSCPCPQILDQAGAGKA